MRPLTAISSAESPSSGILMKALVCSLLGIFIFLTPIRHDGTWTVLLGILSNNLTAAIGEQMPYYTLSLFIVSSLISLTYFVLPEAWVRRLPHRSMFTASHWSWVLLSSIGGIVSVMLALGAGPEWVIGKDTGVTAFIDVAGSIFLIIGLGCLFLPFLTDYGLLEFFGVLLRKPFQKVFKLPGRSAIDVLASWVGSSSIAVLMTSYQYERGYYSARESATLATSFSVVSLPFVWIVAQVAGIEEHFFPFYGTMALVCIVCAIIVPKLPPLSRIPHDYYPKGGKQLREEVDAGHSTFGWALQRASQVAQVSPSPLASLKRGFVSMIDIFVMMMPAAMTIEFLALAVYYHTPIFQWLSAPLIPLLNLMQIPEAEAASAGMIVGLLDQFVPAIIAGSLDSQITRFILAGLSVTQLIFFAETALLIMRSRIPISVPQLIAIFFIRTVIALPLLAVIAHLMF